MHTDGEVRVHGEYRVHMRMRWLKLAGATPREVRGFR